MKLNGNNYNAEFACWLRVRMAEMNKSCHGLADEVGTTLNSVSNWRRGVQRPSLAFTGKLANALSVKEETIRKKLSYG